MLCIHPYFPFLATCLPPLQSVFVDGRICYAAQSHIAVAGQTASLQRPVLSFLDHNKRHETKSASPKPSFLSDLSCKNLEDLDKRICMLKDILKQNNPQHVLAGWRQSARLDACFGGAGQQDKAAEMVRWIDAVEQSSVDERLQALNILQSQRKHHIAVSGQTVSLERGDKRDETKAASPKTSFLSDLSCKNLEDLDKRICVLKALLKQNNPQHVLAGWRQSVQLDACLGERSQQDKAAEMMRWIDAIEKSSVDKRLQALNVLQSQRKHRTLGFPF